MSRFSARLLIFLILFILSACDGTNQKHGLSSGSKHTFSFNSSSFLLDGRLFQILAGEMHYSRIPPIYWRHRIRMAKALGLNTVATYVFWSFHEVEKGRFDFQSPEKNLGKFLETAAEEGMWVILRPGPYSCGEWDLGGIPPYLLSIPDIKLRCLDDRYMKAVRRYIHHLAKTVRPYLVTNGGPILLVQIENEYGSYGNDRAYMNELRNIIRENGIDTPLFTSDGATPFMLEAGTVPGCAVGLDPCYNQGAYDLAKQMNPNVPVFSSETYPGWLTHWGEKWARSDTLGLIREVCFLMDNNLSVNFYVVHGGTNFAFSAGANSGGAGYQPDVTSYDYDAPIDEQGRPRPKFFTLQRILRSYNPDEKTVPLPDPVPVMDIPKIDMKPFASLWDNLPDPVHSVQPKPFEFYHHYQGLALYRTRLVGRKKGVLRITELHDYATVFLDGTYIGTIDRSKGGDSIIIPETEQDHPVLDILVEGMGRINFGAELIDRKGITERVTLQGMTLMNWDVFLLPLKEEFVASLYQSGKEVQRPGHFFKGTFTLTDTADTFFDLTGYEKGFVWINGHNLGRYWKIGPQKRLYCPASWLRKDENELIVFDLHRINAKPITGHRRLLD